MFSEVKKMISKILSEYKAKVAELSKEKKDILSRAVHDLEERKIAKLTEDVKK